MSAPAAPESEPPAKLNPNHENEKHETNATTNPNATIQQTTKRRSTSRVSVELCDKHGRHGHHQHEISNGDNIKSEPGDTDSDAAHTTATTLRPSPPPSIKRRESQAAETDTTTATTELGESRHGKKRKRAVSPPWQFPTVDAATVKTVDGRRVSARVNTATGTPALSESDGPGRQRSASQSVTRSRPASPPWKKFQAAGPTSIQIDGVRKSGRVNKDLPDSAKPKRVSPRQRKVTDKVAAETKSNVRPISRGKIHDLDGAGDSTSKRAVKRERGQSPASKIAELQAQIAALEPTPSFPSPGTASKSTKNKPKRKHSNEAHEGQSRRPSSPSAVRKVHGLSDSASPLDSTRPAPRIKLRFGTGARLAVSPPHPHAKFPLPAAPPRLSLHQVIEKYELLEMQQPYTENDSGPPDAAEFRRRHTKQAQAEGEMRRRLVDAMRRGGVYSRENLALLKDTDQREPPQQYGHNDHLFNHVLFFRQLQLREKTNHRALAKKVANEALEYWKARRGPTEEDLRLEEDRIFRLVYKQVVLDMRGKWDMVANHVQQLKQEKWEAEEAARRQERLQKQLERAEAMVAKQRGNDGDDSGRDREDAEDMEDTHSEDIEAENMTDSESESAESEGADMSDDALAAYLAQREAEPPDGSADEQGNDSEEISEPGDDKSSVYGQSSDEEAEDKHTGIADLLTTEGKINAADFNENGREPGLADTQDRETRSPSLKTPTDTHTPATAPRRSRRSLSAVPNDIEEAIEAQLSEDESVDMDSEDYDSDEDMSDSDDDVASGSQEGDVESIVDRQDQAERSTLGFFLNAKEIKSIGLPTPTTSAEGDVGDRVADPISEDNMDVQIEARAAPSEGIIKVEPIDASVVPAEEALDHHDEVQVVSTPQIVISADPVSSPEGPRDEPHSETAVKALVPVPALLRGQLRTYQHAGLDWLASLYRTDTNGILADEMGLGKTIQTISLLAHLAEEHGVWDPHLVIVPTSVILNWVTEFQKFLPGFRVLGYYGSAEERAAKRRGWINDPHHEDKSKRGYNVIITSYNVAMQDINAIRNVKWHYLVLDEAHNIRNFNSQRWQVLIRLTTKARLLLTGTPLQNSLTELWSLLTFLAAGSEKRGISGKVEKPNEGNRKDKDGKPKPESLEDFLLKWKEPVREIFDGGVSTLSAEAQRVVENLHISLRPFLLRRLKAEVEKDLPKKSESVVVCKLSKRQRQLYQEYMGLASTRESLRKGNAVSAGKVLMSLRRVCNHPDLFDPRPIQTSFAMERSPLQTFPVKEALVRSLLGPKDELSGTLAITALESRRKYSIKRSRQLSATAQLKKELLRLEFVSSEPPDASTPTGCLAFSRLRRRERKLQHLRESIRVTEDATKATPLYGSDLRELLSIRSDKPYRYSQRARLPQQPPTKLTRAWPAVGRRAIQVDHLSDWLLTKTTALQQDVLSIERYAETLHDIVERFAFSPPVVTAPILDCTIPSHDQELLRTSLAYPATADYAHEARIRTSIAFPDSRLLMYDSGKLQRLKTLLRDLQSRGSRSLIFTQMTGTLNILERFLGLLNLPYLRLDGSTPVERRQLYSAEFNRPDSKYQCMILSSRAGGVGLNLVGASSVIFYDLDWNPQMDRQCMDRAHRIGQVRDVEVYKMVSEKTVEENILRRANQKSLLDQTVIQQGHFTTEYQQPARPSITDDGGPEDGDDVAKAIERFLGGGEKASTQAIESVEDKEDVVAAQQARKEELTGDDVDFAEQQPVSRDSKGAATPALLEGMDGEDGKGHVDQWMVKWMQIMTKDQAFVPPAVRRLDRHGRDPSHRPKRKR